jgi:hypothetical protein
VAPPPPPVCTFSVSPLSFSADANGALASSVNDPQVTVTASPAGCAPNTWTATSNVSWLGKLTLGLQPTGNASSVSGTGTATFSFKVSVNNDDARTGTISVAGFTVTVTQAAKEHGK